MFSEELKDEEGNVKTVYASTEAELTSAVASAKAIVQPTSPDINQPVKQGHDLTEVDEAMNTKLVDGTGAGFQAQDAGGKEVDTPNKSDSPKA